QLRDELSDAQYFARVADAADCGILRDFHNLWVNQSNGRMRAADVLQAIPLDRVWEVHIAGGTHHNNYLLDAHSGAPPDEVWRMAESWIPRMPNLGALIFEISAEHV